MKFRQLTAFREVMLTGSVSAAARNLNRTQPSVSSLISDLEADLGITLFDRSGGRLHPCSEAHYLMAEGTEILLRLQNTRKALSNIKKLQAGVLRMVSMPGPAAFLLPQIISDFVHNKDAVNVTLMARSSYEVEQLMSAQQFDLGLSDLHHDGSSTPSLVAHEAMTFGCVCALRADDPMAKKKSIGPKDLDGKPLITLPAEHSTHRQTVDAFIAKRAHFNKRFEMQYFMPMFSLVEKQLAYAIVDPLSVEGYRIYRQGDANLVFRPFVPVIHFHCAIVTPLHRPRSAISAAFLDTLRLELARIQSEAPREAPAVKVKARRNYR
jgi:DNA-binding transcriptional LysR family regulator